MTSGLLEHAYDAAQEAISGTPDLRWLSPLFEHSRYLLQNAPHGDIERWLGALAALPPGDTGFALVDGMPGFGLTVTDRGSLVQALKTLHPWRKGPVQIAGIKIDTEWRSDWKWQRIAPHINIRDHRVLDIGCGNGYYGWRMLAQGAELVIGVDPTLIFSMQWLACLHYAGDSRNVVLPVGIEDLPTEAGGFDTVFSMGVLYHRRDPVAHLQRLRNLCRPGGQVVLETLVLEGAGEIVLEPPGRYARMRNVHAVPSIKVLSRWMEQAGLEEVSVLDVSPTSIQEQRSTQWMRFESLQQCLDEDDHGLTIEGHPAPVRAALLARVPG